MNVATALPSTLGIIESAMSERYNWNHPDEVLHEEVVRLFGIALEWREAWEAEVP